MRLILRRPFQKPAFFQRFVGGVRLLPGVISALGAIVNCAQTEISDYSDIYFATITYGADNIFLMYRSQPDPAADSRNES